MKSVFLLGHVRQKDEDNEDIKHIGIFATRADAENARMQLADKPGFKQHPDGFYIDECEIGTINWSEGFGMDWDNGED